MIIITPDTATSISPDELGFLIRRLESFAKRAAFRKLQSNPRINLPKHLNTMSKFLQYYVRPGEGPKHLRNKFCMTLEHWYPAKDYVSGEVCLSYINVQVGKTQQVVLHRVEFAEMNHFEHDPHTFTLEHRHCWQNYRLDPMRTKADALRVKNAMVTA
tara:strand:+ start:651 stop:1124 length:474 start_codon:yes stop_codon:yes gene_type:complete